MSKLYREVKCSDRLPEDGIWYAIKFDAQCRWTAGLWHPKEKYFELEDGDCVHEMEHPIWLEEIEPEGWVSVEDQLPNEHQGGMCYLKNGEMYPFRYNKVLTWKGRQFKFVNLMSRGFWDDNVTHWMPLPKPPKQ